MVTKGLTRFGSQLSRVVEAVQVLSKVQNTPPVGIVIKAGGCRANKTRLRGEAVTP